MAKSNVRRLYRVSKNDSVIAGVCAGIGDYFKIDPVIVRLFFVLITLGYGAGLLVYLIAWIIVPRK